jgi:hypothetical protein
VLKLRKHRSKLRLQQDRTHLLSVHEQLDNAIYEFVNEVNYHAEGSRQSDDRLIIHPLPQSADSGGVLGNLGESARELILKRLSSREWACHYGWSKRQAATSGCAVRRMKTLRADFRKGGCKNPLITMTLGAGGFK